MDLTQLANLGEFIGRVAVLVTLIYLTMQIRENTKSTNRTASQQSTTRASDWAHFLAGNAACLQTFRVGMADPDALETEDDRLRFGLLMNGLWRQFEDLFFQYETGSLNPEAWEGWHFSIRQVVAHPGFRAFWRTRREAFMPSFAAFVEAEIRGREATEAQASEIWLERDPNGRVDGEAS